ncbi:Intraflagellar transport protein -like protein [Trichinella spiralis]|uniref:Intraflagellar transport protein-like protein n=1 Tax=Trichinella spiralis TaxID=6334 RepID=A0A0V1BWV4_TRISP|nr:Intraflagellar transport protein -like protein [Trichinella spiralis]
MRLNYSKELLPFQEKYCPVQAIAWSPNGHRLAVGTAENSVILFDESGERKDKFNAKSADAKANRGSYLVKSLAFSPDSTKLALGQTDNSVFIYKLGLKWTDKKIICNKFVLKSPVACLIWVAEQKLIIGTFDGRIRLANPKTNKVSTIFNNNVTVVSLAYNNSNNGELFFSGHIDGLVLMHTCVQGSNWTWKVVLKSWENIKINVCMRTLQKFFRHSTAPYVLIAAQNTLLAAGCDRRVLIYDRNGDNLQQFDYSNDKEDREINTGAANPGSQSIAMGSFDKIRIFDWNNRKSGWIEGEIISLTNFYTITALCWKPDGSKLVVVMLGSLTGTVGCLDCCLKRLSIGKKFKVSFISSNQVLVKNRANNEHILLRSKYDCEITDVKVFGNDRFVVAKSNSSLLVADFFKNKYSEVRWQSAGNEKYYFEFENVCLVFNAGEVILIEYGIDSVLFSVKMTKINPCIISVRVNERKGKSVDNVKAIAYLLNFRNIVVVDLLTKTQIANIMHDSKIDWLELNETCKFLIWRDRRARLYLYDFKKRTQVNLLNSCAFVQWVPGSDVIVAQALQNLCVWYDVTATLNPKMEPIKGEIVQIYRHEGKTNVVVELGNEVNYHPLDENLIEFTTALEDRNLQRAVEYLETLTSSFECTSMWKQLADVAVQMNDFSVAQKCFAAVVDIPRLQFITHTRNMANKEEDETKNYQIEARMALMQHDFGKVANIYLEHNAIKEAVELFTSLYKWEEAIQLAESNGYPELENLKQQYFDYLINTGQLEEAAKIKLNEKQYEYAIELYLKSGSPQSALKIILHNKFLLENDAIVQTVAVALIKREMYEQAGYLFENTKDTNRALECYRKSNTFDRAVELCRMIKPEEVVILEEQWGDYLVKLNQNYSAVNHYIESGKTLKALEASIKSEQWSRAVEICEAVEQSRDAQQYFHAIAEYLASNGDYKMAEKFYCMAGLQKIAVSMYNKAKRYDDGYRIAVKCMDEDEVNEVYLKEAQDLEKRGLLRDAERLYCAIEQPNRAISMYKQAGQHEQMMRLIEQYHSDHLDKAHNHLAQELQEEEKYKEAEIHYLTAGNWKQAVKMYKSVSNWEDAYRVAKQYGKEEGAANVAYLWAEAVKGESAVRLLQKLNMLERVIDIACEKNNFDFAAELCRLGLKSKLNYVYMKQAFRFEELNNLEMAEQAFIKANMPKEAVLMYVQHQDWNSASRVAEQHCPEASAEIYIGQARSAFQKGDFAKGETYLLRAGKPELLIRTYQEMNLWSEALRACREFLPEQLQILQQEYEKHYNDDSIKNIEMLVRQANELEKKGEHERAVHCYLKISRAVTDDEFLLEKYWLRAAEIVQKFLDFNSELLAEIAASLASIKRYKKAAELYLECDEPKEAIDCMISDLKWDDARKIAADLAPELINYINLRYKDYLLREGCQDELADFDINCAAEVLNSQGEFKKAIQLAKQRNNTPLLEKYLVLHFSELIEDRRFQEAVEVLHENFEIHVDQMLPLVNRLIDCFLSEKEHSKYFDYWTTASLRNLMNDFNKKLRTSSSIDESKLERFERVLDIVHYYANRAVLMQETVDSDLILMAAKISFSLLRYSDILPVEKAFYEAANAAKKAGKRYENLAFLLYNHYMDICDAIDENNPELVDYSDFDKTDIPLYVSLPTVRYTTDAEYEEVKEWVLAASVDKEIRRSFPTDDRGIYEACLLNPDGSIAEPCILTGYPVIGPKKTFERASFCANKSDWNTLIIASRMRQLKEMEDVIAYIENWKNKLTTYDKVSHN